MILGTGIDIIEIDRIKKAIDRWGDHFLNHVFTKDEINYAQKYKYPTQHFAVRFAAKEAIFKAVGDDPSLSWKDMNILNDALGKPYCEFTNIKFKHNIVISLSHSRHYAVANAIITTK